MTNDIKLDKVSSFYAGNLMAQENSNNTPVSLTPAYPPEEDVTVTNYLDKLFKILTHSPEVAPDKNLFIHELKAKIQNNEYKVDTNLLADKLLQSGALTNLGE